MKNNHDIIKWTPQHSNDIMRPNCKICPSVNMGEVCIEVLVQCIECMMLFRDKLGITHAQTNQ
jgi:hypothetical protein